MVTTKQKFIVNKIKRKESKHTLQKVIKSKMKRARGEERNSGIIKLSEST